MATNRVLTDPMPSAASAIIRMGLNSASGVACSKAILSAATASTIARSGTPVDGIHASISRSMTPGALTFSGTPLRSAATATGRNTRSDCR
ncbi:Uncharacterised protein [Mycobacterium tuberculosis]|nr:Uncharacterised protein [Mycobacterium tuberculosis]SGO04012.1 Uncharacterised protein [Mycobacterium tuberculosis]SGP23301.1 Uncharacterised protein [Mycobacterium tuberculosis]